MDSRVRELALFNLGIDSKLRGCDLVALKVRDICHGDQVAWRSKPSWYVLATEDHTVHPDLQRWVSTRMGANVTEVVSSHVPMLSQPDVVIGVIREAVAAVQNG